MMLVDYWVDLEQATGGLKTCIKSGEEAAAEVPPTVVGGRGPTEGYNSDLYFNVHVSLSIPGLHRTSSYSAMISKPNLPQLAMGGAARSLSFVLFTLDRQPRLFRIQLSPSRVVSFLLAMG